MNKVHQYESALRNGARRLLEEMEKRNVSGLVIRRDVDRAFTMHGEELVAHSEILAERGSQVIGCEEVVLKLREDTRTYCSLLKLNEELISVCKTCWPLAHRTVSLATC